MFLRCRRTLRSVKASSNIVALAGELAGPRLVSLLERDRCCSRSTTPTGGLLLLLFPIGSVPRAGVCVVPGLEVRESRFEGTGDVPGLSVTCFPETRLTLNPCVPPVVPDPCAPRGDTDIVAECGMTEEYAEPGVAGASLIWAWFTCSTSVWSRSALVGGVFVGVCDKSFELVHALYDGRGGCISFVTAGLTPIAGASSLFIPGLSPGVLGLSLGMSGLPLRWLGPGLALGVATEVSDVEDVEGSNVCKDEASGVPVEV